MTSYTCLSCSRSVDPDQEPSPREPRFCGDCSADLDNDAKLGDWLRGAW